MTHHTDPTDDYQSIYETKTVADLRRENAELREALRLETQRANEWMETFNIAHADLATYKEWNNELRRQFAEKDAEIERMKTGIAENVEAYVALALRDEYIRAAEAVFGKVGVNVYLPQWEQVEAVRAKLRAAGVLK